MSRTRDLAQMLGKTALANPNNRSISPGLHFIKRVNYTSVTTGRNVYFCFNSEFDHYKVVVNYVNEDQDNLYLQVRFLKAADMSSHIDAVYDTIMRGTTFTETHRAQSAQNTTIAYIGIAPDQNELCSVSFDVFNPFLAKNTMGVVTSVEGIDTETGSGAYGGFIVKDSVSLGGMTFFPNATTATTMDISVYGYSKAKISDA